MSAQTPNWMFLASFLDGAGDFQSERKPEPSVSGRAIQFPGGPLIPLWSSAFHGALGWFDFGSCRQGTSDPA
jgi:hypothetical protein